VSEKTEKDIQPGGATQLTAEELYQKGVKKSANSQANKEC